MTGPQEANLCVPVFLSLLLLMLARRPGPCLLCPCLMIFSLQVSLPLCIPFHAVCIPVYVSAVCLTRILWLLYLHSSSLLSVIVPPSRPYPMCTCTRTNTHCMCMMYLCVSVCGAPSSASQPFDTRFCGAPSLASQT
jgi:hypothetical protein